MDDQPTTFFNVRDFGAVCDGVTDDAEAVRAAIAAARDAGGGLVLLPEGTLVKNKKARPSMRAWPGLIDLLTRGLDRLLTKLVHINWKHNERWTK